MGRNFFRRVSSPLKNFVYPPYYEDKQNFLKCLECEEKSCVSACEEGIIHLSEDGIPIIKFGKNGCTFCDECALVCDKDVLNIEFKKEKLNCTMIINPKTCIAWENVVCSSCQDICPERTILFKGLFNPVIDDEICKGCGFCISVCPADAIEILVGG